MCWAALDEGGGVYAPIEDQVSRFYSQALRERNISPGGRERRREELNTRFLNKWQIRRRRSGGSDVQADLRANCGLWPF